MSEKTSKLTTYDGSDFIVVIDGEVINVVEDIRWEKDFGDTSSTRVRGEIKCTLFDEMPLDKYGGRSYLNMEIFFLKPEETVGKVYSFRRFQLTSHKAGIGLYSTNEDLTYKFMADEVTYHTNYSWDVQDAEDFIEEYGDITTLRERGGTIKDYHMAEIYKRELERRSVYVLVKEEL